LFLRLFLFSQDLNSLSILFLSVFYSISCSILLHNTYRKGDKSLLWSTTSATVRSTTSATVWSIRYPNIRYFKHFIIVPYIPGQFVNGDYLSDDVPFSCCKSEGVRPCIFMQIHDNEAHFNYEFQKDLTVYKDGCRSVGLLILISQGIDIRGIAPRVLSLGVLIPGVLIQGHCL